MKSARDLLSKYRDFDEWVDAENPTPYAKMMYQLVYEELKKLAILELKAEEAKAKRKRGSKGLH